MNLIGKQNSEVELLRKLLKSSEELIEFLYISLFLAKAGLGADLLTFG